MKLTLLILTLLTMFIFNVGCATTQEETQFWLNMTRQEPIQTYENTQVNCTTKTLSNGMTRTVCNQ